MKYGVVRKYCPRWPKRIPIDYLENNSTESNLFEEVWNGSQNILRLILIHLLISALLVVIPRLFSQLPRVLRMLGILRSKHYRRVSPGTSLEGDIALPKLVRIYVLHNPSDGCHHLRKLNFITSMKHHARILTPTNQSTIMSPKCVYNG